MPNIDQCAVAMFSPSFPCNPQPFASAIKELVSLEGTDAIRSDKGKQILWVLMAQAYGQLSTIDLCDEWSRLEKTLDNQ
jgi:hypothetical protein